MLDLDSNCTLSLQEFRGLQKNKQANDLFREIVKQARNTRSSGCEAMPFRFNIMLEQLTNKMTRQNLLDRIEKKMNDKNAAVDETANEYFQLFQ